MSKIKVKEIADFDLLKGLTNEEMSFFCARLKEKKYSAEEVVFREKEAGGDIYFLLAGTVEITQALTLSTSNTNHFDTREKSIIQLSGDDKPVFGEVSLFSYEEQRTATVTALTDCRMGLLPEKDFFEILVGNHEIGYKVMLNLTRIICNRLVTANQNVLKLTTALSLILEK